MNITKERLLNFYLPRILAGIFILYVVHMYNAFVMSLYMGDWLKANYIIDSKGFVGKILIDILGVLAAIVPLFFVYQIIRYFDDKKK